MKCIRENCVEPAVKNSNLCEWCLRGIKLDRKIREHQKAIEKKLRREPFLIPLWLLLSMFYITGFLIGFYWRYL